jgi:hypothetical protein
VECEGAPVNDSPVVVSQFAVFDEPMSSKLLAGIL